MLSNNKSVLIIAPHQDDEVIGCGGTIYRLIERGYEVRVVHVFLGTSGVAGVRGAQSHAIRHAEAEKSAQIGGYTILPNLGFTDRDRSRDNEIQQALITVIRQQNPAVVFIPHKHETDYEHKLVATEAREALWLAAVDSVGDLPALTAVPRAFYYEVWKNISRPSVICDITTVKHIKRDMLAAFASQMECSGWLEGSLGRNAYRGVTVAGEGYYEVFETEGARLEELLP